MTIRQANFPMTQKIRRIDVPSLGLSVEEITIVDWLISEGATFTEGQEICEVETEKTVAVVAAPFDGVLRKILGQVGDVLPMQAIMAVSADSSVSDEQINVFVAGLAEAPIAISENTEVPMPSEKNQTFESQIQSLPEEVVADDTVVHATPQARKLAKAQGLNLHKVQGSGRNNRISRRDVELVLEKMGNPVRRKQSAAPVAAAMSIPQVTAVVSTTGGEPLTKMRRIIAKRLQESKQNIPHYRVVIDVNMDTLLIARKKLNKLRKEKVSINDFLIKACATTLVKVPDVNIQFDGENLYRQSDADIAVAVALDGGLITPVIRAVQDKSLIDIAWLVRGLVARAKSGTLKPNEYQGGTFCISNLGMFGIRQFDAIINPPQGAILAVGAVAELPVVVDSKLTVASMLTLTLSCDHRVIDGALAAQYLALLKRILETPEELMA